MKKNKDISSYSPVEMAAYERKQKARRVALNFHEEQERKRLKK